MNRKTILFIHITATGIAMLTIACFFSFSLVAEIRGQEDFIRSVKRGILYCLPVLFLAMPVLALSGKKLAGSSRHPVVLTKMKRMKMVAVNGMLLITLAVYLYYHAHFKTIDGTFMIVQIAELLLGFINLTLIGLNARDGLRLSTKPV